MKALLHAAQSYGAGWLTARLTYELQARSGFQRLKFPQRNWRENEFRYWLSPDVPSDAAGFARHWRAQSHPFFLKPGARAEYRTLLSGVTGPAGGAALMAEAGAIREGWFSYFFSQNGCLGWPPAWHRNPITGQQASAVAHWSRIPMYSKGSGDLKFIWEPSRFAAAFKLARAAWLSGDDVHAETFWQLVESWVAANPPNHGSHWRCGQEISLRLMAWCFALLAFVDSPATTPERLALITGAIAAQADRVAKDHAYAHLQRNNHAISEGVGLWTAGLLFPDLACAAAWRRQGREILVREASSQIAPDGSYVQNATNYHRLMLHDYLWVLRLGDIAGDPFPAAVRDRVRQAVAFLHQLQDDRTGRVPCYGSNDGALILPLNTCDYNDFRPVISAGYYYFHGKRLYENGPWDEDLLWFFGPEALSVPRAAEPRRSFEAADGGYYVLRGDDSYALTRCTTYRYRPAQADMLAFDLWRKGQNICCDPGSYLYYADPPWNNGLVRTCVHNTVAIEGADQMACGPRFMWFDWTRSETLGFERSSGGALECFQGRHFGFSRLSPGTVHQRAILRYQDDLWVVVDDVFGEGEHGVSLQWLLAPGVFRLDGDRLRLNFESGQLDLRWNAPGLIADVSCGNEGKSPRGWRSPYYGAKEPALSLQLAGRVTLPWRAVSVFSFHAELPVAFARERIDAGPVTVELPPIGTRTHSISRAVVSNGESVETLEFNT